MPKKLRKDKDTEGDRGTREEATMTSGSTPQRVERKNNKKRPKPSESQGSDTDDSRGSSESDPESEDDSKKAKKQKKQKKEESKKDKKNKKDKKEKKLKKEHMSTGNNDPSQDATTNTSLRTPPPTSSASSSIQSPTPSSPVSTPLVTAVGSMTVTPSLPQITSKTPAMLPRTVLASRMVPRQISRPTPQSSILRPGTSVLSSQPGSIPNVFRAKDIIANHQSHKDITPSSTSTSAALFTSKDISTPTITPAMLKQAEPIVHFPTGNKKQGKHGEFLYGNYPHYYVKRASEQKRAKSKDDEPVEEESENQRDNKNTTSTTRRRLYPQVKIAVKTATTPSVLLPCTGYKQTYTRQGQGATSVQDLARQVDLRLEFLEPSWFYNKRVLDIGCNAALLTVFIALHYQPRKIQGVDIDPSLIRKAQQFVRNTFSQLSSEAYMQKKKGAATSSSSSSTSENASGPVPYEAYFPKSMSYLHGLMPVPPKTQDTETLFPHNIEFRITDWMSLPGNTPSQVSEDEDEAWDVIIGFSLTKWIHLHHGDKGLQEFFHKVYKSLAPGGVFLVEPQAYNTYAKRSKITPTMRENYLAIKMKPEMFEEYLLKTVGFKESKLLGQSEGAATNFNRDIYMFRK